MELAHSIKGEDQCAQCGKTFYAPGLLRMHIYEKHTTEKRYTCSFCQRGFKTGIGLQRHIFTHDPNLSKYECKLCGKKCRDQATLGYHMNTHTGEKPFKCKNCSYAAAALPSLHMHRAKCSVSYT